MSTDDELDRILARGRLSRPQKERMFAGVQKALRPRRRWFSLRTLGILVPAAAVLTLLPLALLRRDGFYEKGAATVGATIEAGCPGGCRQGSTLVFRTSHVAHDAALAAWAEDSTGARIWYFPTDAGEMPAVASHDAIETLSRGVRIGPEHTSQRYTLHTRLVAPGVHTRGSLLADVSSTTSLPLELAP